MTKLELVRRAMTIAQARCQEVEAMIRANNGPVQAGDLLCFSGLPDDCFLEFAVVRPHPDNAGNACFPDPDDLFLLVPVDVMGSPLHGTCDVIEDNEYFGRLVIHCGLSFWMARADIDQRCGKQLDQGRAEIGEPALSQCRAKLAALVRCALNPSPQERQNEADPEYQADLARIATWVDAIR